MKKYIYKVYHGWAFAEYITSFKTLEETLIFIKKQDYPEEWCYEKKKEEA